MNNHQHVPKLLHCSKPSRWRQPPRETRNPQPQRSPSATRCNHSSKCNRNFFQCHFDDESMMEISGRCLLRHTRMLSMSKCQEKCLGASQTLSIDVPKRIEPLVSHCCLPRGDRTRRSGVTERAPPASGQYNRSIRSARVQCSEEPNSSISWGLLFKPHGRHKLTLLAICIDIATL